MEWVMELPEEIKMARGATKALFKCAMAPFLPPELLRRKKMGFSCSIDQWLRVELKELAYDTLLSPTAIGRKLFRPDRVRRLLDEHCSITRDHHPRLWALLMLEMWFRTWIDTPEPASIGIPDARAKAPSLSVSPVP